MADELEDLPGVGPETVERLTEAGFDNYQTIAIVSPAELARTADIGTDAAGDIIEAARKGADIGGFETGASVLERRSATEYLRTGHDGFDDLLGGGIETQSITEVYGNEGSGRTAFAHLLAVRAQLPHSRGGLGGQAAYIDTRGLFDPDRIREIVTSLPNGDQNALASQYDRSEGDIDGLVEDVLEHIHVSQPLNSNAQMLNGEWARDLAESLSGSEKSLRLAVVDSLTFHFRAEYQGREEITDRQQKLNKQLHDLMRLGDRNNAAIVVTNVASGGSKSYGGNIIGHTSAFRIQFKKTPGEVRFARLVDAPEVQDGEVEFYFDGGQFTPELFS